jgi:mannan polymerase II complex MNN11 subunit
MRHALTAFPHSKFFFFLGQSALIMNPSLSLSSHITSRERLEKLMLRDTPVVPPDSVIKTFAHQNGDEVDLILTQHEDGLAQRSFVLRQGDWAKFFLDTWFDPLFRSYNFQKAEAHALVRPPSNREPEQNIDKDGINRNISSSGILLSSPSLHWSLNAS